MVGHVVQQRNARTKWHVHDLQKEACSWLQMAHTWGNSLFAVPPATDPHLTPPAQTKEFFPVLDSSTMFSWGQVLWLGSRCSANLELYTLQTERELFYLQVYRPQHHNPPVPSTTLFSPVPLTPPASPSFPWTLGKTKSSAVAPPWRSSRPLRMRVDQSTSMVRCAPLAQLTLMWALVISRGNLVALAPPFP